MAYLADQDHQALGDPLNYAFASRDAELDRLVRAGLQAGRARLAMQPVVTATPERYISFHEGLIRISDENGLVFPAGAFIPMMEDTAIGRRIDAAALSLALAALADDPDLRLSVNLSARSIGDRTWRQTLDRGLQDLPDGGARLIFEIGETSAMMLHENVCDFMGQMQPEGVCFALDGFGAGIMAFRHLRNFFFDLVKIDKSFVRGIDQDPDNQVLVQALITVAKQFEMFIVADGVERPGEAEMLCDMGADCLQGYYVGAPVLPD